MVVVTATMILASAVVGFPSGYGSGDDEQDARAWWSGGDTTAPGSSTILSEAFLVHRTRVALITWAALGRRSSPLAEPACRL